MSHHVRKDVDESTHPGLVDAIAVTLARRGLAALPHSFVRSLLTRVPKSAQSSRRLARYVLSAPATIPVNYACPDKKRKP